MITTRIKSRSEPPAAIIMKFRVYLGRRSGYLQNICHLVYIFTTNSSLLHTTVYKMPCSVFVTALF